MTPNDKKPLFDPPIDIVVKSKAKEVTKKILPKDIKAAKSVLATLAQVALIVYLGAMLGTVFNNKVIQSDCIRIGVAKAGDVYIKCSVFVPPKDAPTVPPR